VRERPGDTGEEERLQDLLAVVVVVALFGLMAALARLCDSVHTR